MNISDRLIGSRSMNFSGFDFQFRTGTQDQDYMVGFPAVETPAAQPRLRS
jgi:predicted phage tail protein